MEYYEFDDALKHYNDLYERGLKKEANKYIESFSKEMETAEESEKEQIFYRFIGDLCDSHRYDYLKMRGNGELPFALKQDIRHWLYERCLADKMPELRWFYELFHNDAFGVKYTHDFLKKAYKSKECDAKTVNLLFASYIDILGWGAHHFPDARIIDNQARDDAFEQCRKIMEERIVDETLQAQLKYYEVLYSCYDRYCSDGKKKDFKQYCTEANIAFYECEAFYFHERYRSIIVCGGTEMELQYKQLTEQYLDEFIEMRIAQLREEGATEQIDIKPNLLDYYHRHMADGTFVSWLAFDGEKIVGTSGMSFVEKPPYFGCPSGKIGLLSSMYTHPDYRRRGIATELLDQVVNEARQYGCGTVQITAADMGVLLYTSYGFVKNEKFMYYKL
ncbi:MAG: GNAT family N-acetyltransferase [Candidatus Gastranaerophilales bacterium]|nr:GNAT family N-acetyltransferase [Candidatus Gastranaerophilales bacterium]